MMLGLFAFIALFSYLAARRLNLSFDDSFGLIGWCTFAGIVGGRVAYLLECSSVWHMSLFELCDVQSGGLSVLGALVSVPVVLFVWSWFCRKPFLPLLDLVCFCAPLFDFFGRLGCLFGGCCYGVPSQLLSVMYLDASVGASVGVPLLSIQLITALLFLFVFCLFLIGYCLFDIDRSFPGFFVLAYFFCAAFIRFGVDFFRGDRGDAVISFESVFVTGYQVACLMLGCIALVVLGFVLVKKYKKFGAL